MTGKTILLPMDHRPHRLRYLWMATLLTLGIHVSAFAADPVAPYLGRWDMTLQTPERAYSSWLDIQQVDGQLRVRMVGRWGHARWLQRAEIANGQLCFVSPKEEEGRKDTDMVFEGTQS